MEALFTFLQQFMSKIGRKSRKNSNTTNYIKHVQEDISFFF